MTLLELPELTDPAPLRHPADVAVPEGPVLSTVPDSGPVQATLQHFSRDRFLLQPNSVRRRKHWSWMAVGALTTSALASSAPWSEVSRLSLSLGFGIAGAVLALAAFLAAAGSPQLMIDTGRGRLRFVNLAHRRLPPLAFEELVGWQFCRGLRTHPRPGTWQLNLVRARPDGGLDRFNVLDSRDRVGLRLLLAELVRLTGAPALEHGRSPALDEPPILSLVGEAPAV